MSIKKIFDKKYYDKNDIVELLSLEKPEEIEQLRQKAEQVLKENIGEKVFFRGLIEFSNICTRDCYYCGIRKSNRNVNRYTLTKDEIIPLAKWCAEKGYGSLVLQSGERQDDKFTEYIV